MELHKKSNWRLGTPVLGLLMVIGLAGIGVNPALAQTWNGSASNQWNNASNWTPNTIPNSSVATVIINSTTNNPVLISGINPTVGDLTLGSSGNSLDIENGQSLSITAGGTISNAGTVAINSTGSGTLLYVGNGSTTTTLNGGGTVDMTSSAGNALYGDGGVTLDNVNNTIQGQGCIGCGHGMALQNQSIVNANVASGTLVLDGNTTTNTGTLEATNGGQLQISNDVTNVGGIISTDTGNGSTVVIDGHTVSGGTLNGDVRLDASGTLNGITNAVTNQRTVTIDNGNTGVILGNIQNTGSIIVNSTGSGTLLYVGNGGTTTLTGGGTVDMTSSAGNALYGDGGATLVNTDNTIQGQGCIGCGHGIVLQNAAIVDANVSGGTLQLDGDASTNTGTLEATNGGELLITNNGINNAGGIISTDTGNGSKVVISGVTISGGTLNGNIHLVSSGTLNGVINSSTVTIDNGNTGIIAGTITNNGSLIVGSTGSGTLLYVGSGGTTTLTGGGTVDMTSSAGNALYGDGGVTLVNTNNTIEGQGCIGCGHGMVLQNEAIVNANGGTLQLDGDASTNTGTLEATNGGELLITNNGINNAGGIISTDTGNGSEVVIKGVTVSGGTLNGNIHLVSSGTLNGVINSSTVTIDNGNEGVIAGTITNNGSLIVNSTGSGTLLYTGNGGSTTLTGGGIVDMTSSGANQLYGDGNVTFENVNNTIEGQGCIGCGHGMILQNDLNGVVNANVTNGTLTLDGSPFVSNAGTLEATNGGVLQISTTVQNNPNSTTTGGLIKTDGNPNSVVFVDSGTIQGGTLNGNVQLVNNSLLDGRSTSQGTLNNQGMVTVLNGNTGNILGTINNTGSIVINSTGSGTALYVGNGSTVVTTLTGNGTVNMTSSGANELLGDGSATLDNQGNTIEGQGCIGCGHGVNLTNTSGTVLANVNGGTLSINGSGTVTNSGTFKATNGGTLLVSENFSSSDYSGGVLQGGGTYVINGTVGHSTLRISSLGTGGGEITTIGAGTTLTLNGTNPNVSFVDASGDNAISNLNINQGTLNLQGGYNLSATTTFTNSGNVLIDSASSLSAPGNDYLQTAGITEVDGSLSALAVNINGGVLEGDGTVSVSGIVQIQSGAAIQAGDTLTAPTDPPGTLDIVGPLELHTGSTVNETISGAALADISLLNVAGNVDTGSSEGVDVMLLNGFNPTTSSTFVFLDYTGTLSSQTFFVTDPTIDTHGTFGIGYGAQDVYLTFTPNTSPVPEPATFLPLAGLLAAVAYAIRKRQQQVA